jgi:hypothetical protein
MKTWFVGENILSAGVAAPADSVFWLQSVKT